MSSLNYSGIVLCTAVLGLLGCGAREVSVGTGSHAGGSEKCSPQIGDAVYQHACQHGTLGPYSMVEAVPGVEYSPPEVSTQQHVFDIDFSDGQSSESEETEQWFVAFTPAREGEHAIFFGYQGRDVELEVAVGGARLARLHDESIPEELECGQMTAVRVVLLEQGVPTVVSLRPGDVDRTRIFFEHMPTFGEDAWEQRCD